MFRDSRLQHRKLNEGYGFIFNDAYYLKIIQKHCSAVPFPLCLCVVGLAHILVNTCPTRVSSADLSLVCSGGHQAALPPASRPVVFS